MVIDCVTSNITFPAGVVDCINYSFNCCDTIFTIYAWFAVRTLFDITKVNVVFNLTICINGSRCVVTINKIQTFRQFNGLSVSAISRVFQFCIAKVNASSTYLVDCLTVSTCTGCYSYIVTFFNFCSSRVQLVNVYCISTVYARSYVNDCFITSIDTTFSNGWTLVDYQTIISNASTTDS